MGKRRDLRNAAATALGLILIGGGGASLGWLPGAPSRGLLEPNRPIAASAESQENAQTVALDYENRRLEGPLSVHILRVDPRRHEIILSRALSDGVGREQVSSIARRNGAVAAVNGGFFGIGGRYDGDPIGTLKIGENWYSDAPFPRPALGWRRDGSRTLVGKVSVRCRVEIGGKDLVVDGLNRSRGRNEAILYTWAFHRSTLADPGGQEIAVGADGTIQAIRSGGDSAIPPDGFVYSLGPGAAAVEQALIRPGVTAKAGCRIEPMTGGTREEWNQLDFVVGGTPVLLVDGVADNLTAERIAANFRDERHPRTAIGIREDGSWVLVVVDGRQADLSVGMTLAQLAALMQQLGCRQAINLDGGGSTTLFLNGRVVNSPSDFGVERPVSEAILVQEREGPN